MKQCRIKDEEIRIQHQEGFERVLLSEPYRRQVSLLRKSGDYKGGEVINAG